ncbi:MAG TPA: efflux RND transporter periplasmic adaptor subunit [Acidocella sp.]|nr:efflux RND transporter periplasmic adaptor subunit [Acidocella sp.]
MVEPNADSVAKPKKRLRWLLVLIGILVVGIFAYWRHQGAVGGNHPQAAQAVGVAKVISGPMPEVLTALGTVTPTATVTVLPQLSGYLTEVAFTEGQNVTKGEFLAQIDPRQYEVQLEQYSAQQAKDNALLAQAKSDLARYETLQRQDSISAQQVADQQFLVSQDEAAVKVDQAQIDNAKLDLTYCHIVSPATGKVGLRLVDPGNYVTSGSSTGIAVVTTIVPITVIFSIPQTELGPVLAQIQAGATLSASAYSSDDTSKIADGTLTAIDNQVNTSTGTVKLRASFANTNEALFPNEFVNIHLTVATLQNATLVPSTALQSGAPGNYVYRVNADKTVSVQVVTPGPTDGKNTVVTKGLVPGDIVVTDGVDRLSDGAAVTIASPVSAVGAGAAKHKQKNSQPAAQ